MGSFKLRNMTLRSLFGKPATLMYPVVQREYFERTKGHIKIDIKDCILCGLCEKKCPAQAIKVEKSTETWTIDPFRCVQCGGCVIVCPKKCLHMINTYTAPATEKTVYSFTKPELTPEEKAAKEAAETEKAARIEAARAAKAARDAAKSDADTASE